MSCGSLVSLSDATCSTGITRRCVGACGLMSLKASIPSPRFTTVAGISPAATSQKMHATPVPSAPERLPQLLPELLADLLFGGRVALDRRKRSEEHTSELQSRGHLVCRLLLEKKKRHRTGPE